MAVVALGDVFQRFVEKSPISVMAGGLVERLLNPDRLNELFERSAISQYTRELLFSTMFDLMSEVVMGARRSVHAAYQASREEISVSIASVYNKLDGIETVVSAALVRETGREVAAVIEEMGGQIPALLPGYRVKILDGNAIAATEHRIRELRSHSAGPLPGKSLVVLDPQMHAAIDVFPCEDGHAQERSLLGEVLKRIESRDVWIADRNFCTLGFLFSIARLGAYFVIRQHGQMPWEAVGPRRRVGRIETGTVYEQKIRLVDEQGKVLIVRRVSLQLKKPTRDGDRELSILTNLSARAVHGKQVADLYRNRWTIENAFRELTQDLSSEINTLGYPKAALFAFAVALVAYNVLAVIKAALRAAHGVERIERGVSGYYLADEISGTYRGMAIAIESKEWAVFHNLTVAQLAALLTHLATKVRLSAFQKHPRGPKRPQPPRQSDPNTPHVSTARLIASRKRDK